MNIQIRLIISACLTLFSNVLPASPISFSYEGQVTSITDSTNIGKAPPYLISDHVSVGDDFFLTYTFESTSIGSCACSDRYNYINSISDIRLEVAELTISLTNGVLTVDNNRVNQDQYLLRSDYRESGIGLVNGKPLSGDFRVAFDFIDTSQTVFDTRELPVVEPPPQDFDVSELVVWANFPGNVRWVITNQVDSIGPSTTVPVPSAITLLASGLLMMGSRRRISNMYT